MLNFFHPWTAVECGGVSKTSSSVRKVNCLPVPLGLAHHILTLIWLVDCISTVHSLIKICASRDWRHSAEQVADLCKVRWQQSANLSPLSSNVSPSPFSPRPCPAKSRLEPGLKSSQSLVSSTKQWCAGNSSVLAVNNENDYIHEKHINKWS